MHWFKKMKNKGYAFFLLIYVVMLTVSLPGKIEIFCGDGDGYYMYLPATFIAKDYHHLSGEKMSHIANARGEVVIKYTCGVSYFMLPFFLAAHGYSLLFHLPHNGYSAPYRFAIMVGCITYVLLGLVLLRKLLSRYFRETAVWVTLLTILCGTNLYFYTIDAATMSHPYSFFLVCAILLLADNWYTKPGKGKAILLATLLGWLTLTRPTSILLLIFILLYRVATMQAFRARLVFFASHWKQLLLSLPFFILPFIPQMLYWKEMLGSYISYSYQDERFIYWANPKILAVLFDTQNGLFLYAPVLLFAVYGLWLGRKVTRTNFTATVCLFVAITYVFASWHAWWFGGAYGHRSYIEYMPVFAFPLCVAFEEIILTKNLKIKIPLLLVVALCIYCNIFMTHNYEKDMMWDGPNWRWNYDMWLDKVKECFR